jgi:UDP-N-acetylglucosamine transferase subunit ALG13
MILVTVGTHTVGFDRLVQAADELAAQLDEPVVIQYGSSCFLPRHAQGFAFVSSQEMERLVAQARVVISHAAAGSAILVLGVGKPLVLVPRLKQYSEVIDDHQQQLARALAAQGRSVMVDSPSAESLQAAVAAASSCPSTGHHAGQLVADLREKLAAWQAAEKTARP